MMVDTCQKSLDFQHDVEPKGEYGFLVIMICQHRLMFYDRFVTIVTQDVNSW